MKVDKKKEFGKEYWNQKFKQNTIGWDIGYVSTPLKEYFDQLENQDLKILIPGAGNAYEAEYLFKKGFKNIYVLDFSKEALKSFQKRFPGFPKNQIINKDFFKTDGRYDLIVEQAFFTSFPPKFRENYVKKMYNLLDENGKLVGLWFTHHFNNSFPPYGGTKEEYEQLFSPYFRFIFFEKAYNSIKPRIGREFFILMQKNKPQINSNSQHNDLLK